MWSELCADARMYCALRWPAGAGMWRRGLIWVSSRGLLVLAVQRLSHYYLTRRERDGWTLQTLTLRVALALGPGILVVFMSQTWHRARSSSPASTSLIAVI